MSDDPLDPLEDVVDDDLLEEQRNGDAGEEVDDAAQDTRLLAEHKRTIGLAASLSVGGVVVVLGLYALWNLAGPVSAIVYLILFATGLGLAPTLIGLFGTALPGSASLAKGNFILGNYAADKPYLVQTEQSYRLAVGDDDRYWLDGDWRPVEDGLTNRTVLGWRPFGFVLDKEDHDFTGAVERTATDGGQPTIERGNVQEAAGGAGQYVNGILVDLKELYGKGLDRIGNYELVDRAETEAMRDEVGTSKASEWSAIIGGIVGLILGVMTAYLYFAGAG